MWGFTFVHVNTLILICLAVYLIIRLQALHKATTSAAVWFKLAKEYFEASQSKEAAGKRVLQDVKKESEELHKTAEKVKDTVSKVVSVATAQMETVAQKAAEIKEKVEEVPPKVVDLLESKDSGVLKKGGT